MNFTMFQWRSLKTRVTLFTLAIFLISLWSLAFFAGLDLREDMQRLLGDQQFSTVSILATEVNQSLDDRLRALEQVAGKVSPAILDSPATLKTFLEDQWTLQGLFNAGFFVTRIDGVAVAGLPGAAKRVGVNYLDRDYLIGALKEAKATIGRPVIGRVLRAPVFVMAAPIRDTQGAVIGALAGVTELGQPNFLDRITNGGYGKTGGYLLIAPQHRQVVTASDKSRIMETLPVPGVNPLVDRFLAGYQGAAVIVNPHGVEVLASDKAIPVAGWILSVVLPTAEAFAPIHAMQQHMAIATVLLTLLAGGLTWWILRRQLSPMLTAIRTLSAWSDAGQHPQPLPIACQDEIGELIGSFNRLLATLAQREKVLEKSEAFKNIILNSVAAEIAVVDRDGVIQVVNDRWRRFALDNGVETGRPVPHTEVGSNYLAVCDTGAVASHDALDARNGIQAVLEGRLPSFSLEYPCHSPQQQHWFTMIVMPLGSDRNDGVVITHTEITALKQVEQYEQFRSHILELLTGDQSLPRVLGLEQLYPAIRCSILLLDRDGQHLGQAVAPSLPEFYNAALDGVEIGLGVGSCGTAAFTGERVIVDDIATHPYWTSYRELAARAGLGACCSQPIRSASGQVLGVFAIYHREPHTPAASDLAIIEQSAHLSSIAIERKQMEEELKDSEERWKFALESAGHGVWDWNIQTGEAHYSKLWKEMIGFTESEIGNSSTEWSNRVHPEDMPVVMATLQSHLDGKTLSIVSEFRMLCKDGRWKWTIGLGKVISRSSDGRPLRLIGTNTDITERKQIEDQVRRLAFYDTLTQLPNRYLLNDRLSQTMAASKRSRCYGALMFLDLDNFKALNDAHGHGVGDLLLIEAADRLKSCVREIDTVARFGGDEFVVILNELNVDQAKARAQAEVVAEKIRFTLSESYRLTLWRDGQAETTVEHDCTVSIGVVVFINHHDRQDDILKWADAAMYQAKKAGRNAIQFYGVSS